MCKHIRKKPAIWKSGLCKKACNTSNIHDYWLQQHSCRLLHEVLNQVASKYHLIGKRAGGSYEK